RPDGLAAPARLLPGTDCPRRVQRLRDLPAAAVHADDPAFDGRGGGAGRRHAVADLLGGDHAAGAAGVDHALHLHLYGQLRQLLLALDPDQERTSPNAPDRHALLRYELWSPDQP